MRNCSEFSPKELYKPFPLGVVCEENNLVESSGVSLISYLIKMKLIFLCTDMAEYVLFIYLRDTDHSFLIYRMEVIIFMASNPVITMQCFRALAMFHSPAFHTDKIPWSISHPKEPSSRISVLKAMIMYFQLSRSKNNKVNLRMPVFIFLINIITSPLWASNWGKDVVPSSGPILSGRLRQDAQISVFLKYSVRATDNNYRGKMCTVGSKVSSGPQNHLAIVCLWE